MTPHDTKIDTVRISLRLQRGIVDKLTRAASKNGVKAPTAAKILIAKALDAGIEP